MSTLRTSSYFALSISSISILNLLNPEQTDPEGKECKIIQISFENIYFYYGTQ